jgi:hypothetical protein
MTQAPTPRTTSAELDGAAWHTSSYSGAANNCVEHAHLTTGHHAVRDTKDRTRGTLLLTAPAWQDFLTAVREGAL